MMTKRDFHRAASMVRERAPDWDGIDAGDIHVIAYFLCAFFSVNPRFDRKRFLRACGLDND